MLAQSQVRVALGVLSSAAQFETGRATSGKSAALRARVRQAVAATLGNQSEVAMRFVLAVRNGRSKLPPSSLVMAENNRHGDIIFVNMTERFYLCAWKKILWFQYARTVFPSADWFAIADPDAFVQLAHLGADLRHVSNLVASGEATQHVLWGLMCAAIKGIQMAHPLELCTPMS